MGKGSTLDPLLSGALALEQLPILPGRSEALVQAEILTRAAERIAHMAADERDPAGSQQLLNTAEALCASVINLVAYARGRVPRLRHTAPEGTILLPPGKG